MEMLVNALQLAETKVEIKNFKAIFSIKKYHIKNYFQKTMEIFQVFFFFFVFVLFSF